MAFQIRQTEIFADWLAKLRDRQARARVIARLTRAQSGNLGDVKPVGDGVSEMRIDHGPGYRVYFTQRGEMLILLLCGGTKKTQGADIARARQLARDIEE